MTDMELAEEIERHPVTLRLPHTCKPDSLEVDIDGRPLTYEENQQIIAALRRGHERQYTPLHDFITMQEELDPKDRDSLYRNIWSLYSTTACPPDIPAERPPSGEMVMVPREPTAAMVVAGNAVVRTKIAIDVAEAFRAMLSAAEAEGRKGG